jgi:hypothetical protein
MIGRLFLTMLATLERFNALNSTALPNLGRIIGHYICWAHSVRQQHRFLLSGSRTLIRPPWKKLWWRPHAFDETVLGYVVKHDIQLHGLPNLWPAIAASIKPRTDLPDPTFNVNPLADPFCFAHALVRYKTGSPLSLWGHLDFEEWTWRNTQIPIGGDNLDITTWPRHRRKRYHPARQDPLSDFHIQQLINGEMLDLGTVGVQVQSPVVEIGEERKVKVEPGEGRKVKVEAC